MRRSNLSIQNLRFQAWSYTTVPNPRFDEDDQNILFYIIGKSCVLQFNFQSFYCEAGVSLQPAVTTCDQILQPIEDHVLEQVDVP